MFIFRKCKSIIEKRNSILTQKKALLIATILGSQILFFPLITYAQTEESMTVAGEITGTEETQVEEVTADKGIIFEMDICHKHTGNEDGGGCYSVKRQKEEKKTIPCGGSMVYWPALDSTSCSSCGASYYGDESGRDCWYSKEETVTRTYYELGCQKTENTVVGKLFLKQSTTDWVKTMTLTGGYQITGDMQVSSKPYIWNGESATENNVYEVNASGDYTLQLNADGNANTGAAIVTAKIRNVDVTAPVIKGCVKEPNADWTKEGITVTVTEVVDLQPDGSEGCGLHELPYSYDNGETWTAEASHHYLENGTFTIWVRDKLENISSCEVSFQNIDTAPPILQSVEYDHTKNILSTLVSISATDLQPDGSEGCGLHELPYSFDGGKTWTDQNTYTVTKNGTLQIAVRDKLENICIVEEIISNIDCTGPEITYKMEPASWTNRDVVLRLSAKDINEDGSQGIGLADTWYSLDGGTSWSNKKEIEFEENQKVTVIARDCYDNRTTKRIKINQIDKGLPWVSLKMEIIGNGMDRKVKLQAYAGDDYSGLPEECYSWNKGCSYSTESSLIVSENGTYQVNVRDKAGNVNYAQIVVDVFPTLFQSSPVILETIEAESETKTDMMEETEEWESEIVMVTMEERIEAPEEMTVQAISMEDTEVDSLWEKLLFFLFLILCILLFVFLFILFWSRIIRVFAKDTHGKLRFLGILWIGKKENRYTVKIPDFIMENAMTKQFCFKVSSIFADSHKDEDIFFLFPEDVCVTLTIERMMEMG